MARVREEEFDEGDVWDVLQDSHHHPAAAAALTAATTPPSIRRGGSNKCKKVVASSSKDESAVAGGRGAGAGARGRGRSSAPVAIPASGSSSGRRGGNREEDDDDEGEILPPHEWLAGKMERMGEASPPDRAAAAYGHHRQAGRSKGRELTKVRDAVLPKTAFSER